MFLILDFSCVLFVHQEGICNSLSISLRPYVPDGTTRTDDEVYRNCNCEHNIKTTNDRNWLSYRGIWLLTYSFKKTFGVHLKKKNKKKSPASSSFLKNPDAKHKFCFTWPKVLQLPSKSKFILRAYVFRVEETRSCPGCRWWSGTWNTCGVGGCEDGFQSQPWLQASEDTWQYDVAFFGHGKCILCPNACKPESHQRLYAWKKKKIVKKKLNVQRC